MVIKYDNFILAFADECKCLQGCKRDVALRDRDETEAFEFQDRDETFEVRNRDETETSEAQGRDETETIKTSRDVRDRDVFYR